MQVFLPIAALIMMGTSGFAWAGEKVLKTDLGKSEYENSCAGVSWKGWQGVRVDQRFIEEAADRSHDACQEE